MTHIYIQTITKVTKDVVYIYIYIYKNNHRPCFSSKWLGIRVLLVGSVVETSWVHKGWQGGMVIPLLVGNPYKPYNGYITILLGLMSLSPIIHSFIHSFSQSVSHSFTHSFIHSFIHSLIHSFISIPFHSIPFIPFIPFHSFHSIHSIPFIPFIPFHSFHSIHSIHSIPFIPFIPFIHSFIHSSIHPFIHSFIHSFMHSFMHACMHASMHASKFGLFQDGLPKRNTPWYCTY